MRPFLSSSVLARRYGLRRTGCVPLLKAACLPRDLQSPVCRMLSSALVLLYLTVKAWRLKSA